MLRELRDWAEELACRAGVDAWPPAAKRVALVAAIALVAAAAWRWVLAPGTASLGDGERQTTPSGPASADTTRSARPSAPASATIHVVGAVRHPGVYAIASTARVVDAVEAAGGMLGSADQAGINLARVVTDGEQIVVPVLGAAPPAGAQGAAAGGGAGAAGGGPVNLNTATAEQLDALPGVGPATAQKIVSDRTENGPFRSVDDLLRVPGIGAKKLDALKDLVVVR